MSYNYTETKILIDVRGVKLTLGGNRILDGVDIELKDIIQEGQIRGQVRSILGPSGIGKSQLMKILTGLNKPDAGTVKVAPHGNDALCDVEAGMIGMVAQNYPLFAHLTLLENVVMGAVEAGLSNKEATEKSKLMLDRFSLYEHRNKWPSKLSGGQRQRGAIIQQILVDRKYMVLDEPFSGLDPVSLNKLLKLIIEITTVDEFNTFIIITHDISTALRISDHVHILGRTFNSEHKIQRSGHIIESLNLMDIGIAWRPDIRSIPKYNDVLHYIEDKFIHV